VRRQDCLPHATKTPFFLSISLILPAQQWERDQDDDPAARHAWFHNQRNFPAASIPPGARRNAMREIARTDALARSQRQAFLAAATGQNNRTVAAIDSANWTWECAGGSGQGNGAGDQRGSLFGVGGMHADGVVVPELRGVDHWRSGFQHRHHCGGSRAIGPGGTGLPGLSTAGGFDCQAALDILCHRSLDAPPAQSTTMVKT